MLQIAQLHASLSKIEFAMDAGMCAVGPELESHNDAQEFSPVGRGTCRSCRRLPIRIANPQLSSTIDIAGKGGCGECSALQGVIDLAQPSISHHVKILVESGLIEGAKEGRNYSYTLNSAVLNEYLEALKKLESTKVPVQ